MNTNAQPADVLASFTFGTVKNLTITCGRPAVPIIRDSVYINMFNLLPGSEVVYSSKPNYFTIWSKRSNSGTLVSTRLDPRPSWGIGFPVNWKEIKIAGMVYAVINTQYCATCV